ncbi:MAG: phosphoglucosamine mutase [Tenericutes bacterium]|nr:phosphoglucosamine mutase [Mycoplasmatota bacterium]
MGKYFGTDGIRGDAQTEVTPILAYAVGNTLRRALNINELVIAMDTRQSGLRISDYLARGAAMGGMEVWKEMILSTPMIAHYSKLRGIVGVMITASHNVHTDNGIKIFNKGFKTTPEEEAIIEEMIDSRNIINTPVHKVKRGFDDIRIQYLQIFKKLKLEKTDLKAIYDTANGATSKIAKEIFDLYAPNALQVNKFVPLKNLINDHCGSTYMESIIGHVLEKKYPVGFSFDGDGDRIQAVDATGRIYDGDMIVYMIANHMKQNGTLANNGVVLTKMSNLGIIKALKDKGIDVVLSDVGDKNVSLAMEKHGYCIGGESSGHVILNQFIHTGDGLLVAMYLMKILTETNKWFDELTKDVKLYPIEHVNISEVPKETLKKDTVQNYILELKEKLGEDSLLLVRPSGTENLIRVTLSHPDKEIVKQSTKDLVSFILKEGEK